MRAGALLGLVLLAATARAGGESSWPFWDHYAAHFVTADGRVVDADRDSMTTSEGQSYAMFFALVANDRHAFERLRSWTETNLSHGDLGNTLPSWSWGRDGNGSWRVLDNNSASDADLWIAYSLLQAGALWGSPEYARAGQSLLSKIAKQEVVDLPGIGPTLLPGRNGFRPAGGGALLNPSYSPLPLLFAADRSDPSGPWKKMAQALPVWLAESSPQGYAMDWIDYLPGAGLQPALDPGHSVSYARGSYDAIRVYLWIGMTSKSTPGSARLLEHFASMCRLLRMNPVPPEYFTFDGKPSAAPGPVGFSAALFPFLQASGETLTANEQRERVLENINKKTGLIGSVPRYYDQNLALFALGWQQQYFHFAPDGTLRVRWKQ
jgi:endo-1,4-beta-D-glucanase Y